MRNGYLGTIDRYQSRTQDRDMKKLIGLILFAGAATAQMPTSGYLSGFPASTCLSVSQASASYNGRTTTVSGTIINRCGDKNFRYVAVTYTLLDASGAVVGTAYTNLAGLMAGETWKFRALGFVSAPTYQLQGILAQ